MELTNEKNCGNCHYYWLVNNNKECQGRDLPIGTYCKKYKEDKDHKLENKKRREERKKYPYRSEPDYPRKDGESYLSIRWHAEH